MMKHEWNPRWQFRDLQPCNRWTINCINLNLVKNTFSATSRFSNQFFHRTGDQKMLGSQRSGVQGILNFRPVLKFKGPNQLLAILEPDIGVWLIQYEPLLMQPHVHILNRIKLLNLMRSESKRLISLDFWDLKRVRIWWRSLPCAN